MMVLRYPLGHIMTTLPTGIKHRLENPLGNTCSTSDTMNIKVYQKVLVL